MKTPVKDIVIVGMMNRTTNMKTEDNLMDQAREQFLRRCNEIRSYYDSESRAILLRVVTDNLGRLPNREDFNEFVFKERVDFGADMEIWKGETKLGTIVMEDNKVVYKVNK